MAELQDIFDSGDLTELTLQTTQVRDEILSLNLQNTSQESEITALAQRVTDLEAAVVDVTIEFGERLPEVINTNENLGVNLSLAQCQQYIPNPSIKRYTILQGTLNIQRFLVFWDGTDYLFENLSRAT